MREGARSPGGMRRRLCRSSQRRSEQPQGIWKPAPDWVEHTLNLAGFAKQLPHLSQSPDCLVTSPRPSFCHLHMRTSDWETSRVHDLSSARFSEMRMQCAEKSEESEKRSLAVSVEDCLLADLDDGDPMSLFPPCDREVFRERVIP